jgi:hypothetical protein
MNRLTVSSGVRMVVAGFVAAAGLVAAAPQVHGTAPTRGAVLCNINVIATQNCGTKANYVSCNTFYTKCKSLQGPKDKICSIAPVSGCLVDSECNIQTDYTWSSDCTPPKIWGGMASFTSTQSSTPRPSQVQ